MKYVVEIDNATYHRFVAGFANENDAGLIEKIFKNAEPLPEGHGRLVDADEIDNNIYDLTRGMDLNYGQISEIVDTAQTIIKADRSEKNG